MNINEFLRPFDNMSDYLKALKLVHECFSVKTKNYHEVCTIISSNIMGQFTQQAISNFIDSATLFPRQSGLEFFKLSPALKDQTLKTVLTPEIQFCIICPTPIKLYVSKCKLLKEPMLYRNEGIGKHFK